jgi:hypothetical protein
MVKPIEATRRRTQTASVVAEIEGVTTDYVRKVSKGERNDDDVMDTLLGYQQRHKKLVNYLKTLRQIERSKSEKHASKNH